MLKHLSPGGTPFVLSFIVILYPSISFTFILIVYSEKEKKYMSIYLLETEYSTLSFGKLIQNLVQKKYIAHDYSDLILQWSKFIFLYLNILGVLREMSNSIVITWI